MFEFAGDHQIKLQSVLCDEAAMWFACVHVGCIDTAAPPPPTPPPPMFFGPVSGAGRPIVIAALSRAHIIPPCALSRTLGPDDIATGCPLARA